MFKGFYLKFIATLICVFLLSWVIIHIISWWQIQTLLSGLSGDLRLEAPKEDIIGYDTIGSEIILYKYISNDELPPATLNSLAEDIDRRTPNSQTFLESVEINDDGQEIGHYIARFYIKPVAEKKGDKWYKVRYATTTVEAFNNQTKLTLLDNVKQLFGNRVLADTFNSGSGDGSIRKISNSEAPNLWSDAHDAVAGDTASPSTATISAGLSSDASGIITMDRAFLPFDTSSIPNGSTVTAGTLKIHTYTIFGALATDNDGNDYINIVQTTQPSATTLTTADYDLCGDVSNPTTGGTAIDISSSMSNNIDVTFTLNSTGLSWVKTSGQASSCGGGTGVTCLGLREGHDLLNDPIASGSNVNRVIFYASEQGSNYPVLTITYSAMTIGLKINGNNLKINGASTKIQGQ